jgi:hypothetical protein
MQWKHGGSPRLKKFQKTLSAGKQMAQAFCNMCSILQHTNSSLQNPATEHHGKLAWQACCCMMMTGPSPAVRQQEFWHRLSAHS